ncbi:hypothetical protein GGI05_005344, partial [Coemansia sp. RSA 2603]
SKFGSRSQQCVYLGSKDGKAWLYRLDTGRMIHTSRCEFFDHEFPFLTRSPVGSPYYVSPTEGKQTIRGSIGRILVPASAESDLSHESEMAFTPAMGPSAAGLGGGDSESTPGLNEDSDVDMQSDSSGDYTSIGGGYGDIGSDDGDVEMDSPRLASQPLQVQYQPPLQARQSLQLDSGSDASLIQPVREPVLETVLPSEIILPQTPEQQLVITATAESADTTPLLLPSP